jgi:hypothetical protein
MVPRSFTLRSEGAVPQPPVQHESFEEKHDEP